MSSYEASYEELERRVALIERQLTRAHTKLVALGVVTAASLVASLAPRTSAQALQPKAVTRFEAPFIVVDEKGASIVEISNAPGRYGLTVWGRSGGNVFMGTSSATQGGLVQLHEPKDKLTTQIGPGGIIVEGGGDVLIKNKQGATVAGIGANAQDEGYLSLGNPAGNAAVEAGVTSDNRGFVVAHPTYGPPPQVIPRWLMGGRGGGGAK
jgi:hypothetical protein